MIMTGNKIIGSISLKNRLGFRFLSASTGTSPGRNVMKNDPRHPGLCANLWTRGQARLISLTIGDDIRMVAQLDKPFVY